MLLLQFLKASITSFEFVLFPLNAVNNIIGLLSLKLFEK